MKASTSELISELLAKGQACPISSRPVSCAQKQKAHDYVLSRLYCRWACLQWPTKKAICDTRVLYPSVWSILKPVFRQINCDYKLLRFLNLEIWFFYAHNDNRTNKYLSYNGKYTCNRGDFFYFDKLLLKLYTSNTFKSLPLTTMAAYKYQGRIQSLQ